MVKQLTLESLCIITICENIRCSADFLLESPLPWKLTILIFKYYSKYRWKYLKQLALQSDGNSLLNLEFILLNKRFGSSYRNSILATPTIDFDGESAYCLWVSYYRIKYSEILVCKSCHFIFQLVKKFKKKNFRLLLDHYHLQLDINNLNDVYHDKQFWCQSCFEEVLFTVETEDECNLMLHDERKYGKKLRFSDSPLNY
ncbi:uncharacterized protein LOC132699380 [Cylas formicarius]|uniref:uncharacterized protein LOC132699380 n=1 Tax=Cylas formicarius TaxID=197179 RepID=UPI0029588366|nr:uncharacterized protein LOC132699380 [Cylas formicarius]